MMNVLYIHSSVLPFAAETWHVTCSTSGSGHVSQDVALRSICKAQNSGIHGDPHNMLPAFLAATPPSGLYQSLVIADCSLYAQMVGIWCVWMWQELGRPQQLRLVELGPGRGTLMADLLRSTATFPDFARSISVDLVEVQMLPPGQAMAKNDWPHFAHCVPLSIL